MEYITKIEEAAGVTFSGEQIEVIQSFGRPLSIIACAGAGKTTTLLAKLLYMEMKHEIKPYKMLAISFTRKAVQDIEKRYNSIRGELGMKTFSPKFTTFHAFFKTLLETYPEYENMEIVMSNQYKFAMMKMLNNQNETLVTKSEIIDSIISLRGYLISSNISTDGLDGVRTYIVANSRNYPFDTRTYFKVVEEYERLKRESNQMDFDDLQSVTLQILQDDSRNERMLNEFKTSYSQVLIDEFQDISPIQSEIMNILVREIGTHNLVAIGDDDQCIYRFRGADPSIIIDFEYAHMNAKRLFLSTNYRCPRNILSFVTPTLLNNEMRVDKKLESSREGGEIDFIDLANDADVFVEKVKEDYLEIRSSKDLAILVRDNALRMIISDQLIRKGVPVDIQSMNWSIYNSGVYTRLTDIITGIKRSENDKFLKYSWIFAPHRRKNTLETYKNSEVLWVEDVLNGRLDLGNRRNDVVKEILQTKSTVVALKLAMELVRSNYVSGAKKGFYDLDTVKETYQYCLEIGEGTEYNEFLNEGKRIKTMLNSHIDNPRSVKIHTVHGVKGLEFKNVYIYNPIDRYFLRGEHRGIDMLNEDVEEERRLFYVGVTRAIEKVTFVYDFRSKATFLNECIEQMDTYQVPITEITEREDTQEVIEPKKKEIVLDLSLGNSKEREATPEDKKKSDAWEKLVSEVRGIEKTKKQTGVTMSLKGLDDLL